VPEQVVDRLFRDPHTNATGLAHVAFKIGSSAEELRLARSVCETERTPVLYEAERRFTRSLRILDPDGNEIALYVDVSDT
jgi:catechol-2,3-dioxygenase